MTLFLLAIIPASLIAAILAVAAARRLLMVWAALFLYRSVQPSENAPPVVILCACRNEAGRLPRLIDSLARLDYRGACRAVLIDDCSDDGSPALMTDIAGRDARFAAILLTGRQRGKADALREGFARIACAPDEVLLVIDADHRLGADALDRLADWFVAPDTQAVAIEHPVDRPGRSLVSAYCYLEAAVSEAVTSRGQNALGLPAKLAGGWACRAETFARLYPSGWHLTDDMVFTARIVADGGKVAHAADVVAVQDVPDRIGGYVSQHMRWSAGYAESAGRALSLRAPRSGLIGRIDAIATHAGYFERPLLLASALLAVLGWYVGGTMVPAGLFGAVVALYAVAVLAQIGAALRLTGADWRLAATSLASLGLLAVDMFISIRGIVAGLAGRRIGWATDHRG